MDNVAPGTWFLIFVFLIATSVVLGAAPPLITGAICGFIMKGISTRRGLLMGGWVAVPVVAISVSNPYTPSSRFQILAGNLTLLTSILVTVGLCWWQHRRELPKQDGFAQSDEADNT